MCKLCATLCKVWFPLLLLCLILFRPINITSMCKLCATSPNNVNVSWAVESGKAHTVSVYLVENLTYQDLLNRSVRKLLLQIADLNLAFWTLLPFLKSS
jgi:hypothetical protein